MATELKIGDEGETDDSNASVNRYEIIAETGDSDWPLVVKLCDDDRFAAVASARRTGLVRGWPVKLLPPKPKTETMRRWLWVAGLRDTKTMHVSAVPYEHHATQRPADITYTPDGRIASIVFVNETPPPLNVRVVSDMGEPRDGNEPPKSMGLRVGDVVRLRNGLMDVIRAIDGDNGDCDQPIVGDQFEWWQDGRYRLSREDSERDIVDIVSRVDTAPRKVDAETLGIIWERLRKVSDAASWHDLREAVDDVVATLEAAGWRGGDGQ